MMLSCKDIAHLASEINDKSLPWWRRLSAKLHLAMCKTCKRFVDQVKTVSDTCNKIPRESAPSDMRDQLTNEFRKNR